MNDYVAACREVIAAEADRKEQQTAIDTLTGYTVANDRYDELIAAQSDAEGVLIELPAPDASALLWKLDKLLGEESRGGPDHSGSAWCAAWLDAAMADARRLLTSKEA